MQVDPSARQMTVVDEVVFMSVVTLVGMVLVYVTARFHPRAGRWVCGVIAGLAVFLAITPPVQLVSSLVSAFFLLVAYLGGTGQLKGEPEPPPPPPPARVRPAIPAPAPAPRPTPVPRAETAEPRPARTCGGCGAGAREGSQCAYCGRPV